MAWVLYWQKLNQPQQALETTSQALDEGYLCYHTLLHHPWLDSLRSHSEFPKLAGSASERSAQARPVFLANGGDRLVGVQLDGKPLIGT